MTDIRRVLVFLFALLLFKASALGVPASRSARRQAESAAAVRDAIVVIEALDSDGEMMMRSSGFFIAADKIVTNYYAIEYAASATVKTNDDKAYEVAGMLAGDKDANLALLQLKTPLTNPHVLPVRAGLPAKGEKLQVIGAPSWPAWFTNGGVAQSFSEGRIEEIETLPNQDKVIKISSAFFSGVTGSVVVDDKGGVVGIVDVRLTRMDPLQYLIPGGEIVALRPGALRTLASYLDKNGESYRHAAAKRMSYRAWDALANGGNEFQKKSKALTYFMRTVSNFPEFAGDWFQIGLCFSSSGDPVDTEEAIKAYKRAAEVETILFLKFFPLYEICKLQTQAKLAEAVATCNDALLLNPSNREAERELGIAYLHTDRKQEAVEYFKKLVLRYPNESETHYNLGYAYAIAGNRNAALQEYQVVKQRDSRSANILLGFIDTYAPEKLSR
jgi:S1-C subfamily serine protease